VLSLVSFYTATKTHMLLIRPSDKVGAVNSFLLWLVREPVIWVGKTVKYHAFATWCAFVLLCDVLWCSFHNFYLPIDELDEWVDWESVLACSIIAQM